MLYDAKINIGTIHLWKIKKIDIHSHYITICSDMETDNIACVHASVHTCTLPFTLIWITESYEYPSACLDKYFVKHAYMSIGTL